MKDQELVLPSGAFARIRRILWSDVVRLDTKDPEVLVKLVSKCVTLDGKTLTPEEWLAMDWEEVAPITSLMLDAFSRVTKGGIA